jgi:DNA-directed RNA polymerase specialized sigma24 family protein
MLVLIRTLERVVFWHVVIRECSADEAAELIGVTVKTVQNRLSAVRAKMAAALSISRAPRREPAPL